MGAKKNM